MEKYREFIEMAVKLGANDAKIIKTDSIVTAAWTRWKCRYECPEYNKSLCCPPNSPTHNETRGLVDCYEYALLVHFTANIDKATENLLDKIKGTTRIITRVINTLERDIFLAGYYKGFCAGRWSLSALPGMHNERLQESKDFQAISGKLRHRRLQHCKE